MSAPLASWRSRLRTVGLYGLSLVAGLAAAWAVHEHIESRERELAHQSQVETRERVVAAVDLPAGRTLSIDDLALRDVPIAWLPAHAFDAAAVDQIIGKQLTIDLKQGEVVQPTHIAVAEEPAPAERVLPGRRAVTLSMAEMDVASGMLRPGDVIDLFVSFAHQGQRVTSPLATGVRVLDREAQAHPKALITLDVSEQDAIKLVAARQSGRMTPVLRHRQDAIVAGHAEPKDLAAWIGLETPREPPRQPIPILYGDRVDTQHWAREPSPARPTPAPPDPLRETATLAPSNAPLAQE